MPNVNINADAFYKWIVAYIFIIQKFTYKHTGTSFSYIRAICILVVQIRIHRVLIVGAELMRWLQNFRVAGQGKYSRNGTRCLDGGA